MERGVFSGNSRILIHVLLRKKSSQKEGKVIDKKTVYRKKGSALKKPGNGEKKKKEIQ